MKKLLFTNSISLFSKQVVSCLLLCCLMVATYNAKAEIKHTSVYREQVCYAQCLATYLRKQGANNYYATSQLDKVSTANNNLTIFPNPTSNTISVTYTGIELNSTLAITNYLGMELYSEKLLNTEGKQNLDISSFENGLYIIQIRNNKGLLISQSKLNVVK